jgi:hypothetical protein
VGVACGGRCLRVAQQASDDRQAQPATGTEARDDGTGGGIAAPEGLRPSVKPATAAAAPAALPRPTAPKAERPNWGNPGVSHG